MKLLVESIVSSFLPSFIHPSIHSQVKSRCYRTSTHLFDESNKVTDTHPSHRLNQTRVQGREIAMALVSDAMLNLSVALPVLCVNENQTRGHNADRGVLREWRPSEMTSTGDSLPREQRQRDTNRKRAMCETTGSGKHSSSKSTNSFKTESLSLSISLSSPSNKKNNKDNNNSSLSVSLSLSVCLSLSLTPSLLLFHEKLSSKTIKYRTNQEAALVQTQQKDNI